MLLQQQCQLEPFLKISLEFSVSFSCTSIMHNRCYKSGLDWVQILEVCRTIWFTEPPRQVSHSGLRFKRHFQNRDIKCVANEHKNVQMRQKLHSVHKTAMAPTIPMEQQWCVSVECKPLGLHNLHFKSPILHSLENLPACLQASTGTKSKTRTKAQISLYSCTVIHTLNKG